MGFSFVGSAFAIGQFVLLVGLQDRDVDQRRHDEGDEQHWKTVDEKPNHWAAG